MSDIVEDLRELRDNFQSRIFLHGHRETVLESFEVIVAIGLSEARNNALEEAARYHDELAERHAAAHKWVESDRHMISEREHRRHAASIRKIKETGE